MSDKIKNQPHQNLKANNKKRLIIVLSVIVALMFLLALVAYFGPIVFNKIVSPKEESEYIFFYPADYEVDPYADPKFMIQSRGVYYLEANTGVLVTDETRPTVRKTAVFFEEYFKLAVEGKYEEIQSFYDRSLYNGLKIPEKFTPQKIYDIEIEFYQETPDLNNEDVVYEYYIVRYKIMYNNGTFRNDIGSDETRPLMFTVMNTDEEYKIIGIEKIKYIYGD